MTDPASQQDSAEKKTPSAPSRYDRFVAVLDLVLFSAMIVMGLLGELGVVNNVPPQCVHLDTADHRRCIMHPGFAGKGASPSLVLAAPGVRSRPGRVDPPASHLTPRPAALSAGRLLFPLPRAKKSDFLKLSVDKRGRVCYYKSRLPTGGPKVAK